MDPQTNCIIARGHSSSSHPLQHAIMVCIDAVAKSQGGGAWVADRYQCSLLQQRGAIDTQVSGRVEDVSPDVSHDVPPDLLPAVKKQRLAKHYLCTGYDVYVTKEPCIM